MGKRIAETLRDAVSPMRVDNSYSKPPALDPKGLKIVSFNVCNEDWKPALVEKQLVAMAPDVICLQETNLELTRRLAKRLGLNYAFYGQLTPGSSLKAVLSRYPIVAAENRPYSGMFLASVRAFFARVRESHKLFANGETLERRSALIVSLKVGGRKVDVLDTHLTLEDPGENARELQQLTQLAKARQAQGHTVIVGGDFNSNMTLATPGRADAPGTLQSPTDTPAKYHERYGAGAGNMDNAADRRAGQALFAELQGYWSAPQRTVIQNGQAVTPQQALDLLKGGTIPKGSSRYQQLMMALDGVSHLAARKRFDNLLVSRDVDLVSAVIDQDCKASDHSPVAAQVRWK